MDGPAVPLGPSSRWTHDELRSGTAPIQQSAGLSPRKGSARLTVSRGNGLADLNLQLKELDASRPGVPGAVDASTEGSRHSALGSGREWSMPFASRRGGDRPRVPGDDTDPGFMDGAEILVIDGTYPAQSSSPSGAASPGTDGLPSPDRPRARHRRMDRRADEGPAMDGAEEDGMIMPRDARSPKGARVSRTRHGSGHRRLGSSSGTRSPDPRVISSGPSAMDLLRRVAGERGSAGVPALGGQSQHHHHTSGASGHDRHSSSSSSHDHSGSGALHSGENGHGSQSRDSRRRIGPRSRQAVDREGPDAAVASVMRGVDSGRDSAASSANHTRDMTSSSAGDSITSSSIQFPPQPQQSQKRHHRSDSASQDSARDSTPSEAVAASSSSKSGQRYTSSKHSASMYSRRVGRAADGVDVSAAESDGVAPARPASTSGTRSQSRSRTKGTRGAASRRKQGSKTGVTTGPTGVVVRRSKQRKYGREEASRKREAKTTMVERIPERHAAALGERGIPTQRPSAPHTEVRDKAAGRSGGGGGGGARSGGDSGVHLSAAVLARMDQAMESMAGSKHMVIATSTGGNTARQAVAGSTVLGSSNSVFGQHAGSHRSSAAPVTAAALATASSLPSRPQGAKGSTRARVLSGRVRGSNGKDAAGSGQAAAGETGMSSRRAHSAVRRGEPNHVSAATFGVTGTQKHSRQQAQQQQQQHGGGSDDADPGSTAEWTWSRPGAFDIGSRAPTEMLTDSQFPDSRGVMERDSGDSHSRGAMERDSGDSHSRGVMERDSGDSHSRGVIERDSGDSHSRSSASVSRGRIAGGVSGGSVTHSKRVVGSGHGRRGKAGGLVGASAGQLAMEAGVGWPMTGRPSRSGSAAGTGVGGNGEAATHQNVPPGTGVSGWDIDAYRGGGSAGGGAGSSSIMMGRHTDSMPSVLAEPASSRNAFTDSPYARRLGSMQRPSRQRTNTAGSSGSAMSEARPAAGSAGSIASTGSGRPLIVRAGSSRGRAALHSRGGHQKSGVSGSGNRAAPSGSASSSSLRRPVRGGQSTLRHDDDMDAETTRYAAEHASHPPPQLPQSISAHSTPHRTRDPRDGQYSRLQPGSKTLPRAVWVPSGQAPDEQAAPETSRIDRESQQRQVQEHATPRQRASDQEYRPARGVLDPESSPLRGKTDRNGGAVVKNDEDASAMNWDLLHVSPHLRHARHNDAGIALAGVPAEVLEVVSRDSAEPKSMLEHSNLVVSTPLKQVGGGVQVLAVPVVARVRLDAAPSGPRVSAELLQRRRDLGLEEASGGTTVAIPQDARTNVSRSGARPASSKGKRRQQRGGSRRVPSIGEMSAAAADSKRVDGSNPTPIRTGQEVSQVLDSPSTSPNVGHAEADGFTAMPVTYDVPISVNMHQSSSGRSASRTHARRSKHRRKHDHKSSGRKKKSAPSEADSEQHDLLHAHSALRHPSRDIDTPVVGASRQQRKMPPQIVSNGEVAPKPIISPTAGALPSPGSLPPTPPTDASALFGDLGQPSSGPKQEVLDGGSFAVKSSRSRPKARAGWRRPPGMELHADSDDSADTQFAESDGQPLPEWASPQLQSAVASGVDSNTALLHRRAGQEGSPPAPSAGSLSTVWGASPGPKLIDTPSSVAQSDQGARQSGLSHAHDALHHLKTTDSGTTHTNGKTRPGSPRINGSPSHMHASEPLTAPAARASAFAFGTRAGSSTMTSPAVTTQSQLHSEGASSAAASRGHLSPLDAVSVQAPSPGASWGGGWGSSDQHSQRAPAPGTTLQSQSTLPQSPSLVGAAGTPAKSEAPSVASGGRGSRMSESSETGQGSMGAESFASDMSMQSFATASGSVSADLNPVRPSGSRLDSGFLGLFAAGSGGTTRKLRQRQPRPVESFVTAGGGEDSQSDEEEDDADDMAGRRIMRSLGASPAVDIGTPRGPDARQAGARSSSIASSGGSSGGARSSFSGSQTASTPPATAGRTMKGRSSIQASVSQSSGVAGRYMHRASPSNSSSIHPRPAHGMDALNSRNGPLRDTSAGSAAWTPLLDEHGHTSTTASQGRMKLPSIVATSDMSSGSTRPKSRPAGARGAAKGLS